ncbi:MMPL family transporter [Flammeovirgaceae bacterium SG7u.111]|nr:MMPL family transporter [Flammeovirgaceae bacterium SG7u.132]WPO36151.1 MMPL family transporter [Flammeovirgaceae bacterium SG7u.111]
MFFGVTTTLVAILGFQTSQLNFSENITDILPESESISQVEKILNDSKLNSNLVVHFYIGDSISISNQALPDSIIQAGHSIDSCLQAQYGDLIQQRILDYPDSLITQVYDFFGQYLPLYLENEDYSEIESKLSEEALKNTVKGNFKTLISPIGIFGGKMVMKDPFGLTQIPLKNFQKSQFDTNFQLYKNHLFSKDRKHMLYILELATQANETAKNGELIDHLDELIMRYQSSGMDIEYFGTPAIAVANANRIKADIIISVSLAILVIFALILLYFKNLSTFALVLLPGVFGVLVVLGIMATVGKSMSLISLGVGSIMVGITVDFALHLLSHYRSDSSIKQLFKSITQPLLMSSCTTASAFFALVFINSNAMMDLGIFVGGSVLASALFSLIVLPHLLPKNLSAKEKGVFERSFERISSVKLHKKKWAVLLFIVVTSGGVFYWGNMNFNKDMMSLNYMPEHLAKAEIRLNEVLGNTGKEVYVLSSGKDFWEALGKSEAAYKRLEELKTEGTINGYNSVNALIPSLATQQKRLEKWQQFWAEKDTTSLNKTVNEAATKLGLNTKVYTGLNTYLGKNYQTLQAADMQKMMALAGEKFVVESEDEISLITVIKFESEKKAAVVEELQKIKGIQLLDRGYITNRLIEILSEDFNKLISWSLLIVFAILLIIYGRIEMALTTIAPIAIGWLWTLGIMSIFDLSFNIVNIIICSLIFGLGVDYSIFNLKGLNEKYTYGRANTTSFRVSIFLSGITTIVGIGVLVFAQHPALKSIALLAIIGISSVIFLTFFIQDFLFNLFVQKRKDKGLIPYNLASFIRSIIAFSIFVIGCFLLMGIRTLFYIPVFPKWKKRTYHLLVMAYCRFIIYFMQNIKKEVVGRENADYSKPSVIISNHHSFLDILLMLMFSPKVVMVTNDWVYNSPFFGSVVRYADFILATEGIENQMDKIKGLVAQGYSIVIFPEGTRSETPDCGRFHKGAFYLAEELQLDIQPIITHGPHYLMPKKDGFCFRKGTIHVKFLPKIALADKSFGEGYRERTKKISRYFKEEFAKTRLQQETPSFFMETIHKNYLFKGPVLEWYMRIKIKLENNYKLFDELIPKEGNIIDIGCGYGFLGYALAFSGSGRKITALDYDAHKIEIAKNCPTQLRNLKFFHHDALTFDYPDANVFILSDILHYLKKEEQEKIVGLLINKLEDGGKIIIRDGDSSKKQRHTGTVLTEVFSTNSGFNKSRNKLNYISGDWLAQIAKKQGLSFEVIDNTKRTSNTIFILTKA